MYLRTVKAKGAEGVEFEYIRLVEAYWENGSFQTARCCQFGTQGPAGAPS